MAKAPEFIPVEPITIGIGKAASLYAESAAQGTTGPMFSTAFPGQPVIQAGQWLGGAIMRAFAADLDRRSEESVP